MKKTLILISAVLLIAGLFVACNSDLKSADGTASVNFGNGAKALYYTTTPAELPDVNSLIWWYQAENSASDAVPGETDGWTRINPNDVGFATLNGLKIGSGWTFTIAGKVDADEDTEPASGYTDCVYYGTNDEVTLRRGNNTININLTWVAPTSAKVSFSNIAVYESDAYFDSSDTWKILEGESVKASGSFTAWTDKISTTTPIVAEVGSHIYTVKVYENTGASPVEIATQSVTIYAYPGSTINVTGSIDNLTVDSNVIFNPIVPVAMLIHNAVETSYASLAEAIEAAVDGDTVVLLTNVSLNSTLSIQKSITLDGNSHTIQSSVGNNGFAIEFDISGPYYGHEDSEYANPSDDLLSMELATPAVKNLSLVAPNAKYGILFYGFVNALIENTDVTSNISVGGCGVTIAGHNGTNRASIYQSFLTARNLRTNSEAALEVEWKNVGVSSQLYGVLNFESGSSSANSGNSRAVGSYSSPSETVITGGSFTGKITAMLTDSSSYGDSPKYYTYDFEHSKYVKNDASIKEHNIIRIQGGIFTNVVFEEQGTGEYAGDIIITGGTFDADPQAYVPYYSGEPQSYDEGYIINEEMNVGSYMITRTGESESYSYTVEWHGIPK